MIEIIETAQEWFGSLMDLISGVGDKILNMFSNFPPFLIPLIACYLAIAVIYQIVGRD